MGQLRSAAEEALLQMWEDEGFQAATKGGEDELADYLDDLKSTLTAAQVAVVQTRLENRLRAVESSLIRSRKER